MKLSLPVLLLAVTTHAADFPVPYDTEPDKSGPLPAAEAAAKMTLPPGFKATVFAAEPEVQNPIAMTWDRRGRLWIAENYTYAEAPKIFDFALKDRVLIFEDQDGDGRVDSRKVFTDDVQMLTSVEVGRGGVWAMCPPRLLFIPDRDGNDLPDAPPEMVLDGFAIPKSSYHNFANGLRWGPDGWLYGRCGGTAPGEIGAPGTPDAERIPLRGGMWRYHPQRKIYETLTYGTTNPWGHDWDEHGELFFINTVNGHLWHGIPGAHFMRGSTIDPNPRSYALLDQHADHWHFDVSQHWMKSRDGAANELGGGHAHVGMMIYLGGQWPAEYRGRLFAMNMHGYRANQEILERQGSGYVGKHGKDFLITPDKWFRGIDLSYGPDGSAFLIDWTDTGECHERNGVHRLSGRIFKVTYETPKTVAAPEISRMDVAGLMKLHTHPNEWFSRQARAELADRVAAGTPIGSAAEQLRELYEKESDVVVKLRALWSLHVIGAADTSFLRAQLGNPNEHIRAWAIRLLTDLWPLDTGISARPAKRTEGAQAPALVPIFAKLAREDSSGLVRLVLASTLQRLPFGERVTLADGLVAHAEDASDHNLPLMIWYGLIPVGESDPAALARLGTRCELPITRRYIARRLAEDIAKNPVPINDLIQFAAANPSATFQNDTLAGITEALNGWRKATKPAAWDALSAKVDSGSDTGLRDLVRGLSVLFGDGRALDEVKRVALDDKAEITQRKAALQTLIDNAAPDLRAICEKLLTVRFLNPVAARGLATFDDPAIGKKLVGAYNQFHQSESSQLLGVLVSRPGFAAALLDAIAAGKIPRAELTPYHARQILSFKNAALDKRLSETWGDLRETAADKKQVMAKLKQQLTPAVLAQGDKGAGRAIFAASCVACHRLYGEGGDLGPDLTGAGRSNIDYLLENIVDPSASVSADFRMTIVNLKDGRVLNGFVAEKTDKTLTLKTMTEKVTLDRADITATQELPQSLMPGGLLLALSEAQVRDLFAYLMHSGQVPLPASPPAP